MEQLIWYLIALLFLMGVCMLLVRLDRKYQLEDKVRKAQDTEARTELVRLLEKYLRYGYEAKGYEWKEERGHHT